MPKPVIITCVPTGGIHTPTMSPHLPITPDEIAQASVEAAQAGAAIIHLHARDPQSGKPDPRPERGSDSSTICTRPSSPLSARNRSWPLRPPD